MGDWRRAGLGVSLVVGRYVNDLHFIFKTIIRR